MNRSLTRCVLALVVALLGLLPTIGCQGALATAMYLIKGNNVDPDFPGLKGKKVVVVCRPMVGLQYNNANVARDLALHVNELLQKNVPKIQTVDQRKVTRWTDENTWEEYPEVGKAMKADIVVGIDLEAFSLYQGQTLYQGKANATIRVYDCHQGNKMVFDKIIPQAVYPPNSAVPTSDRLEGEFRREFVTVLADHVARYFYAHDPYADMAQDSVAHR